MGSITAGWGERDPGNEVGRLKKGCKNVEMPEVKLSRELYTRIPACASRMFYTYEVFREKGGGLQSTR